jgi:hypothetical protein
MTRFARIEPAPDGGHWLTTRQGQTYQVEFYRVPAHGGVGMMAVPEVYVLVPRRSPLASGTYLKHVKAGPTAARLLAAIAALIASIERMARGGP